MPGQGDDDEQEYEDVYRDFEGMPTQPYEFYAEAAQESVPSYHVELAKSGRSACAATGKVGTGHAVWG